MELLKNFGIDYTLLIAQIINFLLILWILKKFLYSPILELLKKRQETIQQGLSDAEKSHQLLLQSEEKEKELLKNAQQEAKLILDRAKKESAQIIQDAHETAEKKTEKMIEDARQTISLETSTAKKELSAHVSSLAISILETSLKGFFTEKDQDAAIAHAIKKIKQSN